MRVLVHKSHVLRSGAMSILAFAGAVLSLEAQPNLNGELFNMVGTGGIGTLAVQGNCTSGTFQASGQESGGLNASGTTFMETGSFKTAMVSGTLVLTAFQASFSFPITNPPGQVTGTKTLSRPALPISCDGTHLYLNANTTYQAQIVTSTATYKDQGTSQAVLNYAWNNDPTLGTFSEPFVSTGSSLAVCDPPPTGMLSWWPGDGDTTDIQGGNNGVWVGSAAYVSGEVGSAFSFDGSSYVTVGNPSSLNLTGNQVTLDGWINPSATRNDVVFFGKTAYGQNDYVLIFQFNEVTAMIKTDAHGEVILGSTFVPPLNQWTHLAFTYDGTTMNLYANGALISTGTTSGNLVADSPEFGIGGRAVDPFGRAFRFPGAIDEVEVFNRALTPAEILAIFAAGPLGKCKSPQTQSPQATTLSLTAASATTADFHDAAQVQARLTNTSNGTPVSGKTITFMLGSGAGAPTCSAITDPNGIATCLLTPNQTSGGYTLTASFAGDSSFGPSTASMPFTVTVEETVTKFTATSATVIANGSSATFSATLKEDGVTPIASRKLTFTLGTQSCFGMTDASGTASCTITPVNQPLGPNTVTATFAGDGFYQRSSDKEAVMVFAFLGGGAGGSFVIGNLNAIAGNAVTFWGAEWSSANSLSGGPAPEAFKGVADQASSTPPACGGAWSTRPGNSSNPPDSIPSFMAVIAASSISKSGPTISGDIARIVIVQTNPGYASNPGHAGTGTVVAVLCGR